jgi:hypothetical protein
MLEPRRLTTLLTSTSCYKDKFILRFRLLQYIYIYIYVFIVLVTAHKSEFFSNTVFRKLDLSSSSDLKGEVSYSQMHLQKELVSIHETTRKTKT